MTNHFWRMIVICRTILSRQEKANILMRLSKCKNLNFSTIGEKKAKLKALNSTIGKIVKMIAIKVNKLWLLWSLRTVQYNHIWFNVLKKSVVLSKSGRIGSKNNLIRAEIVAICMLISNLCLHSKIIKKVVVRKTFEQKIQVMMKQQLSIVAKVSNNKSMYSHV